MCEGRSGSITATSSGSLNGAPRTRDWAAYGFLVLRSRRSVAGEFAEPASSSLPFRQPSVGGGILFLERLPDQLPAETPRSTTDCDVGRRGWSGAGNCSGSRSRAPDFPKGLFVWRQDQGSRLDVLPLPGGRATAGGTHDACGCSAHHQPRCPGANAPVCPSQIRPTLNSGPTGSRLRAA